MVIGSLRGTTRTCAVSWVGEGKRGWTAHLAIQGTVVVEVVRIRERGSLGEGVGAFEGAPRGSGHDGEEREDEEGAHQAGCLVRSASASGRLFRSRGGMRSLTYMARRTAGRPWWYAGHHVTTQVHHPAMRAFQQPQYEQGTAFDSAVRAKP